MINESGNYVVTEEDKYALFDAFDGTDFQHYIPRIYSIRCTSWCAFCYCKNGSGLFGVSRARVPEELWDRITDEQR